MNGNSLTGVYRSAEIVFTNLSKAGDNYKEWVDWCAASMNFEKLLFESMNDVSDWESSFRLLKQKLKEVETIGSFTAVGCIKVSTVSFKRELDETLYRCFDALASTLRQSIALQLAEIDKFVARGVAELSVKLNSIAEIGRANETHTLLSKDLVLAVVSLDGSKEKAKLMKSVVGTTAGIDIGATDVRLQKFRATLDNHQVSIAEQVNTLHDDLQRRYTAHSDRLDAFVSRRFALKPDWSALGDDDSKIRDSLAKMQSIANEWKAIEDEKVDLVTQSGYFSMNIPVNLVFVGLETEMLNETRMFQLFQKYLDSLDELSGKDWLGHRSKAEKLVTDFVTKWRVTIDEQEVKDSSTSPGICWIRSKLNSMANMIPYFKVIQGDQWATEHWSEFFALADLDPKTLPSTLTIGNVIQSSSRISSSQGALQQLNVRAKSEFAIRNGIQELEIWAARAVLPTVKYDKSNRNLPMFIVSDWKTISAQVGDNRALLQSQAGSSKASSLSDTVAMWDTKLSNMERILKDLQTIQRKWLYLYPVFVTGSVQNISSDFSRFEKVHRGFCDVLNYVVADSRVTNLLRYSNIYEILDSMLTQADKSQRALSDFLELKRDKFPRFYFIGDEDLLEILGQAKSPSVVQAHLRKLFAGIHTVQFDKSGSEIVAVVSSHQEIVHLKSHISVSENVEEWLIKLDLQVKETLAEMVAPCLLNFDWNNYPQQILSLCIYLEFTGLVEKCMLQAVGFDDVEESIRLKMASLRSNISPSPKLFEIVKRNLIFELVHLLDVTKLLTVKKATSVKHWDWDRHMRFYISDRKYPIVKLRDSTFDYTFEYHGNAPKLVHTNLTDRAFLTMAQAMNNGYGGNPFGPAVCSNGASFHLISGYWKNGKRQGFRTYAWTSSSCFQLRRRIRLPEHGPTIHWHYQDWCFRLL